MNTQRPEVVVITGAGAGPGRATDAEGWGEGGPPSEARAGLWGNGSRESAPQSRGTDARAPPFAARAQA